MGRIGRSPHPPTTNLSAREREVLTEIANGCTDAEIAWRLGIAKSTAVEYKLRIYAKIGVRNKPLLVAESFRRGIF